MKHSLLLLALVLAGCNAPSPDMAQAPDRGRATLPAPPAGAVIAASVDVSPGQIPAASQAPAPLGPKPHTDMVSMEHPHITVHTGGGCGCCEAWARHLEQNGFVVSMETEADAGRFKDQMGVPGTLRACHTGEIEGLFVEGHVPADDIRKMLKQSRKDKSLHGIGVSGMPAGSPGMEMGTTKEPYKVIAVSGDGSEQKVFATH